MCNTLPCRLVLLYGRIIPKLQLLHIWHTFRPGGGGGCGAVRPCGDDGVARPCGDGGAVRPCGGGGRGGGAGQTGRGGGHSAGGDGIKPGDDDGESSDGRSGREGREEDQRGQRSSDDEVEGEEVQYIAQRDTGQLILCVGEGEGDIQPFDRGERG